MKRKGYFIVGIIIIVLLILTGCSPKNTKKLQKFVIGCDNYRPYIYTDEDGEPAGIDVELAKEACRRMGYEPVFKQIEWNQRDNELESGNVDCLWSCYSMKDQEKDYEWVGPYMYGRQVVAVLKDSPIKTLDDLEGKSVVVRVSSQAESIFLQHTDKHIPKVANIYSLNDVDEIITALRNDYADACAGYSATLIELFNNAGISYRFLDEDLARAKFGIAFSKNSDKALRDKLSKALEQMYNDGTTKQILESYGLNTDKALRE